MTSYCILKDFESIIVTVYIIMYMHYIIGTHPPVVISKSHFFKTFSSVLLKVLAMSYFPQVLHVYSERVYKNSYALFTMWL